MNMARLVVTLLLLAPCYPQFMEALLAQMGQGTGAQQLNGGYLEGSCLPPTTTPEPTTTTSTTTTTSPIPTTLSASQKLTNIFSQLPLFLQTRIIESLGRFGYFKPTPQPSVEPDSAVGSTANIGTNNAQVGFQSSGAGNGVQRNRVVINPRLLNILRANAMRRRTNQQRNIGQSSTGNLQGLVPSNGLFSRRILVPPGFIRRAGGLNLPSVTTTPPPTTTQAPTTAAPVSADPLDMYDPFYNYQYSGPRLRRKRQGWLNFPTMAPAHIDPAMCTCQSKMEIMADPEYTIHPTYTCRSNDLACACVLARKK